MTVERPGSGTDRELEQIKGARLDKNHVDNKQPDALKRPLEFANKRLHQKLTVRRAIHSSHAPQAGTTRNNPPS